QIRYVLGPFRSGQACAHTHRVLSRTEPDWIAVHSARGVMVVSQYGPGNGARFFGRLLWEGAVTMVEMTSAEMTDEEDVSLEIRVLGNFAVIRNRGNVCLPPSRKTRALLAYLAVTNRPQHRERLCTMFWEVPDDPRGALRWSLWKIRQIVNINGGGALVTDGNMVVLRSQSIALDLRRIKAISMGDLASQDISELENVARLFRGGFLDDLSLPRCPQFQAWRIAWIDEVNLFKARLLRTLIDRLRGDASRALPYAHALHALHPQDRAIAAAKEVLAERAREQA